MKLHKIDRLPPDTIGSKEGKHRFMNRVISKKELAAERVRGKIFGREKRIFLRDAGIAGILFYGFS